MRDYQRQLQTLRDQIAQREEDLAVLVRLEQQEEACRRQVEECHARWEQEQKDVDRLERVSLAALLSALRGSKDEDLDREQALLLFRTLFREADTGKMAPLDFAVADWDWTPGEECLRLTEYLDTTGTPYEDSSRIVREQTLFLYPDGTAARVLMSPHNTYYYSWARDIGGISEVEEITPSWTRVHIAEDVFSWDNLKACLEALSVA